VSAAMRAYNQELSPFVITRALAVFERTLISGGSPYDLYLQGDEAAISESAKNGLEVFNNVGCGNCHSGLLLTDFEIVNNGIYEVYLDDGLFRLTLDSADIGKFKTPSLRNVVLTGPYMHDGSFATLDEVLDHYASGGSDHVNKSPLISPFTLSSLERENLVYFLESMTDTKFMEWAAAL
jgi:cytochrome c peroxidase